MKTTIYASILYRFTLTLLAAGAAVGCAPDLDSSFVTLEPSSNVSVDTGLDDGEGGGAAGGSTSGGSSSGGSGGTLTSSSAGGASSGGSASSGSSTSTSSGGAGGGNGNGNGAGNGNGGGSGAGAGSAGAGDSTSYVPSGGDIVQCVLGGPSTKITSDSERVLGKRGNGSKSRVCMTANACLGMINAYAVARGCTLSTGAATTPGASGQCTSWFVGSKGTCHNAQIVSDETIGELLEGMAD
jgi:hypothetical protein